MFHSAKEFQRFVIVFLLLGIIFVIKSNQFDYSVCPFASVTVAEPLAVKTAIPLDLE